MSERTSSAQNNQDRILGLEVRVTVSASVAPGNNEGCCRLSFDRAKHSPEAKLLNNEARMSDMRVWQGIRLAKHCRLLSWPANESVNRKGIMWESLDIDLRVISVQRVI